MIFADGLGTTFQIGAYTVRIALRPDNPAFARYLVFRNGELVGKQFSRPDESDCRWLERWGILYANKSRLSQYSSVWQRMRAGVATAITTRSRRGRPRKEDAERQLQEAMAA